jgi:hypothetical protein
MGKGGGGGAPPNQQVTSTTTNLPEYAQPYFENLMQRGQAESYRQYQPYGAERLAGFTPGQIAAQQETLRMQTPGQFGVGTGLAGAGGIQALQAGQYQPGQFETPLTRTQQLQQFQAQGPGMVGSGMDSFTGQGTAEQFMSPYQQSVTDIAKREAIREAQIAQQQASLGSVRQGTYGGARQELARGERERGLLDRLSGLQAEGSQKAFDQAQRSFEQEQARRLQAGMQTQQLGTQTGLENLRAQLGVQQLGATQSLEAQRANQQAIMEAQKMAEQSRQFGGDLGLRGAGQAVQAGQTLGQLGQAQQESDLKRLTAQEAVGGQQRGFEQQRLDQQYADFLRQRDYPLEQLGYFSNLLRGVPVGLSSTQTTSAPPPSIASQIGGLGLAGLGIAGAARTAGFAEGGSITAPPSPEELHRMGSRMPDKELAMLQEKLRTAPPGNETLMAAGEIQTRKNIRDKAVQGNKRLVIADLLTDGAMPQMPPEMQQQMQQQIAMLPENAGGVAALPAPNMDNIATMAAGGMVAFDDGGSVARFTNGGTPFFAEGNRPLQTTAGLSRRQYTQEELDEFRRRKEMGLLSGVKEFVLDPVQKFLTSGSGRQDLQRGMSQSFTSEPVSGSLPADVRRADSSEMASVVAPPTTPSTTAPAAPAAPDAGGIADIAKADAAAKAAADKAAADKAAADKAALQTTGGLDTIGALESIKKDVGDKLEALGDPFADIREDVKKASAERKGELKQSMFMRIAEFGLGMAAGTSPFALVNAGKAGIAALKGLGDDLRERKKLDREDRKLLADIKRLEVADKRNNIFKVGDMSMKIISEMGNENRAKVALNTQVILAREGIDSRERVAGMPGQQERVVDRAMKDPKFAAMYQKLNKPGLLLDPRVKIFMDMSYAEKEQLKLNNPAQYAMLEQLASQALLPTAVGSPDPSKIRP